MLPWKFIVTRRSIPGLALLAGLGVLNTALLLAGDPIRPIAGACCSSLVYFEPAPDSSIDFKSESRSVRSAGRSTWVFS